MDRGAGGPPGPAWLLDIAGKLLEARDLVGSKAFLERAMEADPLLDGVDRILAVVDVLLASQRRRVNNPVDLYALLLLDPSSGGRSASAVRLQYSRLARLLHPTRRQGSDGFQSPSFSDAAGEAFKLVSDAWAVLSDPAKKELYDKEMDIAAAASSDPRPNGPSIGGDGTGDNGEVNGDEAFWTACMHCCNVYQYARGCEGRTLLCQNCKKAFQATEMASPPPIVPGTEMYFCAWGLFPLGFPGGPSFACPAAPNSANGLDAGLCPEIGSPGWKQNKSFSGKASNEATRAPSASGKSPRKTRKKVMAKRPRTPVFDAGECGITSPGVPEIVVNPRNRNDAEIKEGAEAKSDGGNNVPKAGCSRTVEASAEDLDLNFSIDIDATNSILESLSTLPFLKDEEIVVCGKIPPHFKGNV